MLLLLGLGYGVAGPVGDPFARTATLLEAAFAVVVGGLLLVVARGLHRVQGWSRAPAVVVKLLALPVGAGLVQGQVWWAAAPVLLLALTVLYLLATAEARLVFRGLE